MAKPITKPLQTAPGGPLSRSHAETYAEALRVAEVDFRAAQEALDTKPRALRTGRKQGSALAPR